MTVINIKIRDLNEEDKLAIKEKIADTNTISIKIKALLRLPTASNWIQNALCIKDTNRIGNTL